MGSFSRRKGHSFERKIAQLFRHIFPNAKRQLEYQMDTCQGIDLTNTGNFRIQCKKLKKYAPISAIREIKCNRKKGEVPVLITAGNNLEPVAVLPLAAFIELVELSQRAIPKGFRGKVLLNEE